MYKEHHEETVLKSVHDFHMLTVDHVKRLHYSDKSRRYVSSVLKSMAERKLLHCLTPEKKYVNLPNLYMVGIRGVRMLNEIGITAHLHPSNYRYPRIMLDHLIDTNNTIIAMKDIPLRCSNFELVQMWHDKNIKHMVESAYKRDEITTNIVADGIVAMREFDSVLVLWTEIDRKSEDEAYIRAKIRKIIEFAKRDFEYLFGYKSFAVLFVTTGDETRRDTLRMWCERELAALYEERQKDLFWFAYVPEREITPDVFFSPIWKIPFVQDSYVLLQC